MSSDEEIFDLIGVPADKRPELAARLHSWSAAYLPGPNMYAIGAIRIWHGKRVYGQSAVNHQVRTT